MRHLRLVVLGLTVAAALGMSTLGCSCKSSQAELDRNLAWSPSTLDFGQVAIGDSGWQTVTLTHVGLSGSIDFANIGFQNLNTDEFTFDMPEKMALLPGESTTITVYYAPVDSDTDDGFLVIEHNVAQQGNITKIPVSALGKVAELIAIPNPIDFGQVHVGEFADIDVVLRNVGSDIVDITQIYLRLDGSADFTIEGFSHDDGAALPATLNPRGEMGVVVRYEPVDGLCDDTTLIVMGETKGETQAWAFDVTGCELGPKIVIVPGEINYDWVEIDKTEERLVVVQNAGNADLVIPAGGISVFPGSPDVAHIALVDVPTGDSTVAPDGADLEFKVQWTAAEPRPDDGNPVGYVSIASNDAAHSPTMIPVYGKVDAPLLTIIPDALDMGYGAQQVPVQRTLTLSNEGHGALKVLTMEITDVSETQYGTEFAIKADAAFPVTSGGGESTIGGNSSQPVIVTFTNKGPDQGQVTAKLVITTNARGKERVEVPIVARRSGSPVCRIGIGPAGLNYGTVAIGFPEQRYMNLANTGTGVCTFQDLKIVDCSSGMFGGATCGAPLVGTKSSIFTITGVPPVGTQMQPGEVFTMTVNFNAPRSTGLFSGLLTTYYALLGVKARDTLLGNDVIIPNCGTNPCQANLTGAAGIAKVSVLPAEVEFGVNTIGCCSQTYNVCVYNSGSAPLKINDIQLKGCTPEFRVVNVPKLPKSVLAGGTPVCIQTVYRPQDLGPDQCQMHIAVTDNESPTVTIPLRGEGTYETEQIDEFKQLSGQEVDILYVVDESGSMCEEQDRLAQSFSQFIQHAGVWNNDYHIGVVTTNVVDEAVFGKLNSGDAKLTPKFMTPTSGGNFSKLVNVGCEGD
ncbi:MAG TPA: choice-of-anchor D domain-containing protein, partial [Myxococcota bacterium]|nr:choice-of-anchor D domain-containing protein [Myxococcota bacterium]